MVARSYLAEVRVEEVDDALLFARQPQHVRLVLQHILDLLQQLPHRLSVLGFPDNTQAHTQK